MRKKTKEEEEIIISPPGQNHCYLSIIILVLFL